MHLTTIQSIIQPAKIGKKKIEPNRKNKHVRIIEISLCEKKKKNKAHRKTVLIVSNNFYFFFFRQNFIVNEKSCLQSKKSFFSHKMNP